MSGENGGDTFREHRLLILDALKRHEDQQRRSDESNKKSHDEIMKKIVNIEVTAAKQGVWGGLGGAIVVGAKMLADGIWGR